MQQDVGTAHAFVAWAKPVKSSIMGKSATEVSRNIHRATSSSNREKKERRPWEFLRFVQQSSKFVNWPAFSPFGSGKVYTPIKPGDVIWQPTSKNSGPQQLFNFAPLDDVVMGGASISYFDALPGTWRGTITDANNGGFIGIRSTPPSLQLDLSRCQGLEWKIQFGNNSHRGGKKLRFKVIVRDSTEFNGICWTTSVDLDPSPKTVNTLRVPFRKQIPTIFARTVPNQTFQPGNVMAVQLTYSKFEYDGDLNPNFELGDIELQILEIRAY
jgi:hypothetical protein